MLGSWPDNPGAAPRLVLRNMAGYWRTPGGIARATSVVSSPGTSTPAVSTCRMRGHRRAPGGPRRYQNAPASPQGEVGSSIRGPTALHAHFHRWTGLLAVAARRACSSSGRQEPMNVIRASFWRMREAWSMCQPAACRCRAMSVMLDGRTCKAQAMKIRCDV